MDGNILFGRINDKCEKERAEARAEVKRLRAAIVNVRRNLELHLDDWDRSYSEVAIAALTEVLEPEE